MPLADDALVPTRPRSPRLVRALLIGACGAGLLGLSLPSDAPATPERLISANAAGASLVEPPLPHGPRLVSPVARASRSRALPAKRVIAKRKPVLASWARPSYAGVISSYGMRWGRMHKGIDFSAGYGASIRSAGDGVVVGSGYLSGESGYGLITLIRHKSGVVTAYAHQSKSFVDSGDRVSAGETIGEVGSTGHSTGPHLHFEVRMSTHGDQINPTTWLAKRGVYV